MGKKELIQKFQKDHDKYWKVELFGREGFFRKQCPKCGKFFWATTERETCPDASCTTYTFIGNPPTDKRFNYAETWNEIDKFFVSKGHTSVRRYPVVSRWRPDLFFTVASIIDFQRIEKGQTAFELPANPLIVPQVCMRFSDIPNIGVTGRHYSSFVMVGQHAIANEKGYWKDRCIDLDFELLTKVFGIPKDEIVFVEDAWVGYGAFGFSLEYYVRGLELGNAVFTQFLGNIDSYREMDEKIIDMGAGLERFTWITQGTPTSYDAVFGPVIEKMKKDSGMSFDEELFSKYAKISGSLDMDVAGDVATVRKGIAKTVGITVEKLESEIAPMEALYAICDHARTLAYAINDGALPSNTGGGYNLRVVLRRALSFIEEFNFPFHINEVMELNCRELKPLFPELLENMPQMQKIIEVEEGRYSSTIKKSRRIVADILGDGKKFSSDNLAKLYESQGITPELIEKIAREEKFDVQIPSDFYDMLTRTHIAVKEEKPPFDATGLPETKAVYYEDAEKLELDSTVVALRDGAVVLDATIFYPEGGGQAADLGTIDGMKVLDAQKVAGVVFHVLEKSGLKDGQRVHLHVDGERRKALMRHHSATHILNYACRKVLGKHVWQAGARKEKERAHLDITHYERISPEQLKQIEIAANRIVLEDRKINITNMERGEAERKYGFTIYQGGASPGKMIRIVEVDGGIDAEACAGLHLPSTGKIGMIKIMKEERIQDGISRIQFVAGEEALKYAQKGDELLRAASERLKVAPEQLASAEERFFNEWKDRGKRLDELEERLAELEADKLLKEAKDNAVRKVLNLDAKLLEKIALRLSKKDVVAVLANQDNDVVAVTPESSGLDASQLLAKLYSKFGGTGGGSKRFARGRTKQKISFSE
ncbi:MAG: alanine--tRNA ligase [Candidatus Micrarchaeota archaeon]|nr:alanine--tRNA ligase [Candidatus Micrarchaeota archaeon]